MYVVGRIGWPGGFLFSGDAVDEQKATWSGPRDTTCRRCILSFLSSPSFLHPAEMQGRTGEDYGAGACGHWFRWRVLCSPGPFASPTGVFCVSLFFEVEECQLRSRQEKRRVDVSECRARGVSLCGRWRRKGRSRRKKQLVVGGSTFSFKRFCKSFVISLFFYFFLSLVFLFFFSFLYVYKHMVQVLSC